MESIILTERKDDGQNLSEMINSFNFCIKFETNYIKEDVTTAPQLFDKVESIFSTWNMPLFTEEELHMLFPSLKAVFYSAGTVKYFAGPFLNNGIKVFSAANANSIPVAEYVASQIVLANKGYFLAQKESRSLLWQWGFWKARRNAETKAGNYHSRVGVIGCGNVGSEVVRLLRPYELDVVVYDPFLDQGRAKELGVKKVELEELFSTSDVVTNHLPNIPETKGMIDYRLLSMMKPQATFINTGRGAQVNENDLARILGKHKQMCALLDVTQHEPPFPWSPLGRRNNVFLTPHIAGSLGRETKRMVAYMLQAYDDWKDGRENACEVKREQLARIS